MLMTCPLKTAKRSQIRAEKNCRGTQLLLLNRRKFLKKLYKAVYKGRALLVGIQLPFDLSRIAIAGRPAEGDLQADFPLALLVLH